MLNLLPSKQKKELHLDLLTQIIISSAVAVIFMLLILALLCLVAQSFLNVGLDEAERDLSLWQSKTEIKELENLEKKVKELNRNLVFLDTHQKEQVKFSLFLENLVKEVPSGLRLNSISVKDSVNISGYALTRDILLSFKNNLEKAPYVSDFDFPLSNLTKSTNINFSLSFKYAK